MFVHVHRPRCRVERCQLEFSLVAWFIARSGRRRRCAVEQRRIGRQLSQQCRSEWHARLCVECTHTEYRGLPAQRGGRARANSRCGFPRAG